MKLTKEDYMRLPKERLAELLVERDNEILTPITLPKIPSNPSLFECDGIHCINPQMDCINCPRRTTGGIVTSPNTTIGTSTLKVRGNE